MISFIQKVDYTATGSTDLTEVLAINYYFGKSLNLKKDKKLRVKQNSIFLNN